MVIAFSNANTMFYWSVNNFAVTSLYFIFSTQGPRDERVGENEQCTCHIVSTPLLLIDKVAQVTSSFSDRAAITRKAYVRTTGQFEDREYTDQSM